MNVKKSNNENVLCSEQLLPSYLVSLSSLLAGGSRPVPAQEVNVSAIVPVILVFVTVASPRPAISHAENPWIESGGIARHALS